MYIAGKSFFGKTLSKLNIKTIETLFFIHILCIAHTPLGFHRPCKHQKNCMYVFKPILVFSLAKAEQYKITQCKGVCPYSKLT